MQDGARPLITPELFDAVAESAQITNASAPAVPVTDTVKVADENGVVRSTPERTTLYAVQTPPGVPRPGAFKSRPAIGHYLRGEYHRRLRRCRAAGQAGAAGAGDGENIKITRPLDLTVAEAILKKREERA